MASWVEKTANGGQQESSPDFVTNLIDKAKEFSFAQKIMDVLDKAEEDKMKADNSDPADKLMGEMMGRIEAPADSQINSQVMITKLQEKALVMLHAAEAMGQDVTNQLTQSKGELEDGYEVLLSKYETIIKKSNLKENPEVVDLGNNLSQFDHAGMTKNFSEQVSKATGELAQESGIKPPPGRNFRE